LWRELGDKRGLAEALNNIAGRLRRPVRGTRVPSEGVGGGESLALLPGFPGSSCWQNWHRRTRLKQSGREILVVDGDLAALRALVEEKACPFLMPIEDRRGL